MKKTQLDKLIKEEVDKALMNEMIEFWEKFYLNQIKNKV